MYKTDKMDNGSHHYLVFFNRKSKRYNAVQLTHLYIKDKERFKQVKKGLITIEKFKEFDVPSGVKKEVYTSTASGKNIDLNDTKYVDKVYNRHLSAVQSKRIKAFINKKKKT